jgi:predicted N-acetyltransferase YhbS
MQVRPILYSDVESVVRISERFYDEMGFDDYGYRFDKAHITRSFTRAAANDSSLCFVAERNGAVVGVILFTLTAQTWYFKDRLTANEIVWHTDPDLTPLLRVKIMKLLMEEALKYLKHIGCKLVIASTPQTAHTAEKILVKYGFSTPQTYYMKEM